MARSLRSLVKSWFQTGDVPTQAQYSDTIDSSVYWEDDIEHTLTNDADKVPASDAVYAAIGAVPTPNLNEVLVEGNETLGTNIKVNDADAIELENASLLKKGTYDFGGLGGISRICGVGYEDMWQSGIHHVFDNMGFLRESTNCFNLIPDANFDSTLRFQVGSRWVLDDGTLYVCADASVGAAVWNLISNVPNLQEVTDEGSTTTNSITAADVYSQSGTSQVATLTNGDIVYTPDTTAPTNKTVLDFGFPTATNTITLQDGSGTVAFLSDITGGGGSIPHATASGTDTYTATISGVTAYNDGDAYLIRFTNGNTTGATLNINSIGAVTLYRNNDGPLIGGDIIAGGEMLCIYNSTTNAFQLIGTAPNTLLAYVTNADSVSITKGQVVYAFGGQGDRMTVKRANNSSEATSSRTVGVVLSTSIGANQKGIIIIQGLLDGLSILPTSTFADGDSLYLGSTAGSITNVKPSAPNNLVYLGVVTTASNGSSGRWYVKVQNGYELNELHDVAITSVADNQVLQYDSATSLWKNETLNLPTNLYITTGDQSTSGTANVGITGLSITTVANKRYAFEGFFRVGCNATGGLKFTVTAPAGSTLNVGFMGPATPNSTNGIQQFINASGTQTAALANANSSLGIIKIYGEVSTGATTGTIQVGFASAVNTQLSTVYQNGTNIVYTER